MAFHLGCLQGLFERGLLDRVAVISSVSGGSVLAALYCSSAGDFAAFEKRVRQVLRRGFLTEALLVCCTTTEGAKAVAAFTLLALERLLATVVGLLFAALFWSPRWLQAWLQASPVRRWASRTTILKRVISRLFGGIALNCLRKDRPRLIIVACELRAKAAIYFTADKIHCWRYGTAPSDAVELAHAVTASAAYPLLLPAFDEYMSFKNRGIDTLQRVSVTDGGVYDNLGPAPLWPDRDPDISMVVGRFDHVIACRAGYSLEIGKPTTFFRSRMSAAFESVFARSQNYATKRLFDLQDSGKLKRVLLPYLGQNDKQLSVPPSDLVSRDEVANYPTNFSGMSEEWINRLSLRGKQLVHALLDEHWPDVKGAEKAKA